jgi:hypothetical protein
LAAAWSEGSEFLEQAVDQQTAEAVTALTVGAVTLACFL